MLPGYDEYINKIAVNIINSFHVDTANLVEEVYAPVAGASYFNPTAANQAQMDMVKDVDNSQTTIDKAKEIYPESMYYDNYMGEGVAAV